MQDSASLNSRRMFIKNYYDLVYWQKYIYHTEKLTERPCVYAQWQQWRREMWQQNVFFAQERRSDSRWCMVSGGVLKLNYNCLAYTVNLRLKINELCDCDLFLSQQL